MFDRDRESVDRKGIHRGLEGVYWRYWEGNPLQKSVAISEFWNILAKPKAYRTGFSAFLSKPGAYITHSSAFLS